MTKEASKTAILSLLQQNARLSARELAERLALQEADVEQVIAECEKDNTIHGYYTLVNLEALPLKVRAVIEVSVQPERDHGFDHIARKMAKFPQVTDVTLVSGTFDLMLTIIGDDLQEVADFIATKLAPMAGIRHHSTHFVLKKYKEAGFILDNDENYERLSVSP